MKPTRSEFVQVLNQHHFGNIADSFLTLHSSRGGVFLYQSALEMIPFVYRDKNIVSQELFFMDGHNKWRKRVLSAPTRRFTITYSDV